MNEFHPDDEVLSAWLDGERADATASAHLDRCELCRARRGALDGVRRAVASAPPPPRRGATDRAVAAALEAWSAERGAATVVPMAQRRFVRRVPAWALGAAAVVAALLVAVPMVTRGGGGKHGHTASAPADRTAAEALADTAAAASDGGDLGEQSDQLALGEVLRGAVRSSREPAGDASARPAPAGGRELASSGDDDARVSASPPVERPCVNIVRDTYGTGLGRLVYTASLRWQGTPAVLLAYRLADQSGPGPDHRAFVMAEDGCRLLVVQGF